MIMFMDVLQDCPRRSIYYTGNNVNPSPNQVFSEYTRHVMSLSKLKLHERNGKHENNLGASPPLNLKSKKSVISE